MRVEGKVSFEVRNTVRRTCKSCFSTGVPNGLQLVLRDEVANIHKKSNQFVNIVLKACSDEVGGRPDIIPTYVLSYTQEPPFESGVIFEEDHQAGLDVKSERPDNNRKYERVGFRAQGFSSSPSQNNLRHPNSDIMSSG